MWWVWGWRDFFISNGWNNALPSSRTTISIRFDSFIPYPYCNSPFRTKCSQEADLKWHSLTRLQGNRFPQVTRITTWSTSRIRVTRRVRVRVVGGLVLYQVCTVPHDCGLVLCAFVILSTVLCACDCDLLLSWIPTFLLSVHSLILCGPIYIYTGTTIPQVSGVPPNVPPHSWQVLTNTTTKHTSLYSVPTLHRVRYTLHFSTLHWLLRAVHLTHNPYLLFARGQLYRYATTLSMSAKARTTPNWRKRGPADLPFMNPLRWILSVHKQGLITSHNSWVCQMSPILTQIMSLYRLS